MNEPILKLDLPGLKKVRSGKVREVFDLGDSFLLVASDRISAFDVIMPNGIPRKGEVLTQVSHFWFEKFSTLVPNHLLAKADDPLPKNLQPYAALLARRSMIVKKAKPLAIECIVRGYLSGSGWKEYKKSQTVCGLKLPAGLTESAELPEPIFTPSTKAEAGHDENISFEEACKIVGKDVATAARDLSLIIYKAGRDYARQRGIIIADTKFEFGHHDGKLILLISPHARLLAVLAGGPISTRQRPAQLRQAVRTRLPRNAHLGQNPARPQTAGGRRRQNQREVCGRV